jgi:hypothetical protein
MGEGGHCRRGVREPGGEFLDGERTIGMVNGEGKE